MSYVKKRKSEFFYKKAKQQEYRARSAYKLIELQEKFRFIKKGDVVVDCGAAPGSWSQVALEFVGIRGMVIGVDVLPVAPITENFRFVQGDLTKPETTEKIRNIAYEANVIISDAAPEFSGIKLLDMGAAIDLNFTVLDLAKQILKKGGNFVCKSFQSKEFQRFLKEVKKYFREVYTIKPKASQKNSPEIYVIALEKKANHQRK